MRIIIEKCISYRELVKCVGCRSIILDRLLYMPRIRGLYFGLGSDSSQMTNTAAF